MEIVFDKQWCEKYGDGSIILIKKKQRGRRYVTCLSRIHSS
jgi:hypothetical protein